MIHASKLFPQALANILAQCKEEEKEKADPIDHEMVGRIHAKRKKRARVRLTEREKVQLTFNL